MHEVARELEAPFQNTPNDIPLTTFQAQFNEALITMYAGYHPDAFWSVPGKKVLKFPVAAIRPRLRMIEEDFGEEREIEAQEP